MAKFGSCCWMIRKLLPVLKFGFNFSPTTLAVFHMLTLLHSVCQILIISWICFVFPNKLSIIVWILCSFCPHYTTWTPTVFLFPPLHIIALSPSVFYSCVRPPATGYPTGPNQSNGGCGWYSGPQLCRIRQPHPHHPVEERWCLGVYTWLQGQTARHGCPADTLCKGNTPGHVQVLRLLCNIE